MNVFGDFLDDFDGMWEEYTLEDLYDSLPVVVSVADISTFAGPRANISALIEVEKKGILKKVGKRIRLVVKSGVSMNIEFLPTRAVWVKLGKLAKYAVEAETKVGNLAIVFDTKLGDLYVPGTLDVY